MKVKTHIGIKDIDIKDMLGFDENKQNDLTFKVISSAVYGAGSHFAFGVVRSIPAGHILKCNDNPK